MINIVAPYRYSKILKLVQKFVEYKFIEEISILLQNFNLHINWVFSCLLTSYVFIKQSLLFPRCQYICILQFP